MTASLFDILSITVFSGALVSVAAVGLLAIPWRDEELDDTVHAVRSAGRLVERMAHRAGDGVRALEPLERATHVFEPPPLTRGAHAGTI